MPKYLDMAATVAIESEEVLNVRTPPKANSIPGIYLFTGKEVTFKEIKEVEPAPNLCRKDVT